MNDPDIQGDRFFVSRRAMTLVGLTLALVVALFITILAGVSAIRRGSSPANARATATSIAQQSTTPSAQASATPGPGSFVCANAPGAQSIYAFVNDTQLYLVNGCSTPKPLTNYDAAKVIKPLGFSPANHWLMLSSGPFNVQEGTPAIACQTLLNLQTGATIPTSFCEDTSLAPSRIMRFVGWQDENTFLEAEFTTVTTFSGPIRIQHVNAATLRSTLLTSITWVANLSTGDDVGIEIRGNALYYGGYMSLSEGGAWLHRVSLADGADTRLVKLGIAGTGGCQVYEGPCAWTGPWDVSPDGTHLAYHNPGPTQSITDTYIEPGTPLYFAKLDGSGAVQLFGGSNSQGFTKPFFSPTSSAIVSTSNNGPQGIAVETLATQRVTTIPDGSFLVRWRNDGAALLLNDIQTGPTSAALFEIATGKVTQLPGVASSYVWGA